MPRARHIPVIDLFAGPGGLSEGFASLADGAGLRRFDIKLSIEKDEVAHRTLTLRAFFRALQSEHARDPYYDYVRGVITRSELFAVPHAREAADRSAVEARRAELGFTAHQTVDGWIRKALDGATEWALIGGPPCQAYSLAGRARMRAKTPEAFEGDERHLLYTEYLRVIRLFGPSVFVMENVKGILNSQHGGSSIFGRILSDLAEPGNGLRYQVRSLVVPGDDVASQDFVIQSENFGVPQSRHRVILFGVRSDLARVAAPTLKRDAHRFNLRPADSKVSVGQALGGIPALRSRLSRQPDSSRAWLAELSRAPQSLKGWRLPIRSQIEEAMADARSGAELHATSGAAFIESTAAVASKAPAQLRSWLHDPRLGGVAQHESRAHMASDLHRYMFAACFAQLQWHSPKLRLFPPKLRPAHANMDAASVPFVDRFRVQVANEPSTTVVSHISKDGHYYIHPDPSQCRSLTVREAARLQTFPDNYFFEGNRTQQYQQVGNAVPPYLARQIAEVVFDFIEASRS